MSRPALLERLADACAALPADRVGKVALDGPSAAGGRSLADDLGGLVRTRGRPVLRVSAADFLRPASVRLELGRDDPDAYYDACDTSALGREVLGPLGPGGSGWYLPTLWDADTDRATRAARLPAPPRSVLLLDGPFLLRPELSWGFDLVVHLALSAAARRRRVAPGDAARELPAHDRYDAEVGPAAVADLVVRLDDPARPALLDRRTR